MIINQVVGELQEEMSDWIEKKLLTEIQKYKKKNVEWFDIIQKLIRKGYKIADIKKVIKQNFGG
jgi:DNA-binding transcriptional MerR regulator